MEEIALITSARTYKKGESIYMAGDEGGKLYVLHIGQVKISRISPSGKEQIIRILGPGEFMGETSLFNFLPLIDNAEVLEDSTMCVIEGGKLQELMLKYSSISFKIMMELSRRLQKAENLIESINLYTADQRIAQEILELTKGKDEILLSVTKGNFASQLGLSQETLSRSLSSFQEKGLIELQGQRRIIIKDREGLKMIV